MTDGKNGRDTAGRFAPGNPGKPAGARHKSTLAAQALLDGEAETLTRRALQAAIMGDIVALRLCLERVLSPRRDNPVAFTLPPMTTARDAAGAAAAVLQAVSTGDLTPREGTQVMALVDSYRRTLETSDLEARVAALEG